MICGFLVAHMVEGGGKRRPYHYVRWIGLSLLYRLIHRWAGRVRAGLALEW